MLTPSLQTKTCRHLREMDVTGRLQAAVAGTPNEEAQAIAEYEA
jgi:hypothetical protein